MKLVKSLILAASIILPVSAFAQTSYNPAAASNDSGVTRAQVRAELVQLENAGYNPAMNDINYPQNLQAAERHLAQQR